MNMNPTQQKDLETRYAPLSERRPAIVSVICLIGWIYIIGIEIAMIFFHQLTLDFVLRYGIDYPLTAIALNAIAFVALFGVWRMRSWGVILYIATYILGTLYSASQGTEYFIWHVPATIIALIFLFYIKKFE